jgi:Acyl-CoA reductase (LuxC)
VSSTDPFKANIIIRGQVYDNDLVEFGGRGEGDFRFLSPDPHKFLDKLPLSHPNLMADLYDLTFEDILDYLEALGERLRLDDNEHLQKALEGSYFTAPTTPPMVKYSYETLCTAFRRDVVTEMAEQTVGIRYLEGWVPSTLVDGRTAKVRAFGSRQLHIVAGNAPLISAMTIVRNAISRSDSIIKSPSNDPFTALAIVQTMCDMAPDHPLTKHISVAYWKGGDEEFERAFYQPHNIEKIVAWGGLSSVKHVTKYIQPGLELISLDPKRSISIVGQEVFDNEDNMRDAARRLAVDFGTTNQVGCVCSRIAYVQSGTEEDDMDKLKTLAEYTYQALLEMPDHMSTSPKEVDRELKANLEAIELQDDWYHVVGGENDEGAVIVSLLPEPVSFCTSLNNRILNMVPIDDMADALDRCDSYTQTIGIYPESLKDQLRDKLPLFGAQRIVSLGYAVTASISLPQDSIEPLRRACKWIVDEQSDPSILSPYWPKAS